MLINKLINYHEPQLKGWVNNVNFTSVCFLSFSPCEERTLVLFHVEWSPVVIHCWLLPAPLCIQPRRDKVTHALGKFGRNNWPCSSHQLPLPQETGVLFFSSPVASQTVPITGKPTPDQPWLWWAGYSCPALDIGLRKSMWFVYHPVSFNLALSNNRGKWSLVNDFRCQSFLLYFDLIRGWARKRNPWKVLVKDTACATNVKRHEDRNSICFAHHCSPEQRLGPKKKWMNERVNHTNSVI